MENEQQTIEQRLEQIEFRNRRVELDKAWEASWARRIVLAFVTYLVLGLYMWAIVIPRPWLNSIVPAVGFLISTLSVDWLKKKWMKHSS